MRLFGTSGIRAKYGAGITPETALAVGKAIGTLSKEAVVGRDTRTTGEVLEHALIAGILSAGGSVIRAGCVTTPTLALCARENKCTGAMITASHNPAEYNGIKLWQENGMAFTPQLEGKIEQIIEKGAYKKAEWKGIGTVRNTSPIEKHLKLITEFSKIKRKITVVADCANGPASMLTPYALAKAGCTVHTINANPDGYFPGRNPEPTEETLKSLSSAVKATGAELGIAHDGDADRVAAVDEKGSYISGDKLLALACAHYLQDKKGTIVTTVDAGLIVEETVEKNGGKLILTRVGDVAVAEQIVKTKAIFGGEPCGAWIHPSAHLAPDGPLSAAFIAGMASEELLGSRTKKMKEYPIVREKITCPNEEKEKAIERFSKAVKKMEPDKISRIDGVLAHIDSVRLLVRPSGTEPAIRVRAEGKSEAKTKKIAAEAKKLIEDLMAGQ